MDESVLQALMRLFAMVASVSEEGYTRNERDVLVEYLQRQFSDELVRKYLDFFDRYIVEYHLDSQISANDKISQRRSLIDSECEKLNNELQQSQKIFVLVFLLDFINKGEEISDTEFDFLNAVVENLRLNREEFLDALAFTFDHIERIKYKSNLLFIDNESRPSDRKIKHLRINKIIGRIKVLHINITNTYILRYYGSQVLTLNGHVIKTNRTYILAFGSVIKNPRFGSIYYTWVAGRFIQAATETNFVFEARNIEFSYGNTPHGIKRFYLNEESGRLIGIIGGSGSGKSTLLKVLSGVLKPRSGSILINGFDIHKNHDRLEGIIGYVPQDDFLIKELTVFQNLYINARLSFSEYSEEQIVQVVEEALLNFDLSEARDLRVGDSLNTYLSGGQRKRLNIALELIREPSILFVDEPTSGLSSADSEKVMNLLKRQTFKGKLVFANIHQPSSEIFRLFDKLLVVDQGGRIIYYGNPLDAISYFKRASNYVDAEESECLACGNIEVDQILRNVEARIVDVNGRLTRKRKTSPEEWYRLYNERIDPIIQKINRPFTNTIPQSLYRIPSRWQQIKIFFMRDILAKLKNNQYLIITLLEAPILALILSFYTRSSRDSSGIMANYTFGLNENIPSYLFMAVIVALFLGLVISAEEIFRDRKLLEREQFLDLSRFSYLFSKISILFFISAIQMIIFIVIGNIILEIRGMIWRYFLVLFTTSCLANVIGLNISSGFKSVVTIYILVPLILVPQLLFSGVVVDFNNLNRAIYMANVVPRIGDSMTSRWAYEALMVTQFKDNTYEQPVFQNEFVMSNAMFRQAYIIPALQRMISDLSSDQNELPVSDDPLTIRNEIYKISKELELPMPESTDSIINGDYSAPVRNELLQYLAEARAQYHTMYLNSNFQRENILSARYGNNKAELLKTKHMFYNEKLASVVKNDQEFTEYIKFDNELVRIREPIFTPPFSKNGRTHFYAAYKKVGELQIDTFWFNILMIWLSVLIWFAILYYDVLRKLIRYFENIQLQRFNRRILNILKQYETRR
jgi:ABC-type multidrug transport system ATPase subunit